MTTAKTLDGEEGDGLWRAEGITGGYRWHGDC